MGPIRRAKMIVKETEAESERERERSGGGEDKIARTRGTGRIPTRPSLIVIVQKDEREANASAIRVKEREEEEIVVRVGVRGTAQTRIRKEGKQMKVCLRLLHYLFVRKNDPCKLRTFTAKRAATSCLFSSRGTKTSHTGSLSLSISSTKLTRTSQIWAKNLTWRR